MLEARARKRGRGQWARRTGVAALTLVAAATWMAACSNDPAGIRGEGDPASLTVTPAPAELIAVGDELEPTAERSRRVRRDRESGRVVDEKRSPSGGGRRGGVRLAGRQPAALGTLGEDDG